MPGKQIYELQGSKTRYGAGSTGAGTPVLPVPATMNIQEARALVTTKEGYYGIPGIILSGEKYQCNHP
jgi:hypothetical protein